jgi:acetyl esterase
VPLMAPLHPQARAVLDEIVASRVDDSQPCDIAELRRLEKVEARFSGPPQEVAAVRDLRISGPAGALPIRLYFPDGQPPHPTVMFIHGGGCALGSVELSDEVCRALCRASNMLVASVGYRLAPEHPFPAGLDDCAAALRWLGGQTEVGAIAVGGDSAGGNLAAATALLAREQGISDLALQLLIYPALDPALGEPSMDSLATGYGLTKEGMRCFWDMYLQSPDGAANPHASPLRASDLSGVAPAFILTAEYDPLVDEGERYAGRLKESGVRVLLRRFDGMIHGFVSYLGRLDAAQAAIDDCARALREAIDERR